jgi:polyferredoxin
VDLLRSPLIGPILRWRHTRTAVQLTLLAVALLIVVHGFAGPEFAAGNLSTVLTWVHYRGLLVLSLLAVGNLFCFGCPMIRVRDWGRKLRTPTLRWPAWLRGKWLAIALFAAVLFTYELFDLWTLPRATAVLVLSYFVGVLIVDMLFTGAAFCKHVCPVGQFNFLASTVSPFEVQVRQASTCASCKTEDCIAGKPASALTGAPAQRGCELGLFQPSKVGNLDCTFCLDCVAACPHDNIAIASRVPAVELAEDQRRSAIGRLADRTDYAVLAMVFVSGAFLNAFAMTSPGFATERWLAGWIGLDSEAVVLGLMFVLGLFVFPYAALRITGAVSTLLESGSWSAESRPVSRFAFGLVPLGFGVWLAHYGFHLLTGALVIVPVAQSAMIDVMGQPLLGDPLWRWAGVRPGAVLPIQLGVVLLGTLGSAALMSLIAGRSGARSSRVAVPWMVLVLLLGLFAGWVLFQPMEMRGTGFGA